MASRNEAATKKPDGPAILRALVAPHKGQMALISLLSFGSALLEALFIVLVTGIGMALVSSSDTVEPAFGQKLPVTMALIVAAVSLPLRVALSLWAVKASAQLTAAVTTSQRRRLSTAYLRTSWAVQQAEPAGRLQELLTSFVGRMSSTVSTLGSAITAALSLGVFLGTGLLVNPVSTGAVLFALAALGGILTPIRRAIRRRSTRNLRAGLAFANAIAELGSLGLEMQTYGVETRFETRVGELSEESAETARQTQTAQGALPHLYMTLAYGAVLSGIAFLSLLEVADLAVVGAVMLLMLRSISYGQQLSTASASIAASLPFLEGLEETVRHYNDASTVPGTTHPSAVAPLEVQNVKFVYTADRVALAGLSFRLEAGEALGVVGPSGAGKSTLAQLLLGLRSPTSGTIRVAGVPLHDADRNWWTSRVAFVAQDAQLFTGTVAENVRFFRDGITDEDLREACRKANILADIEALPKGFDTHLGERGSQLSGGQRQRLSIARALAGRPEMLILDEPTSALDGQSEALIRSTLAELHGRLTVVIIAHRMSTLEACDRIMVIESGRMTALGVQADLLMNSDFYRRALAVAGITLQTGPMA